jgi:PadR family transcriptional regulator PadR
MEDLFDNWTVQVRKGVLELCILAALRDGERYGYELVKRLVAVPGVQVAEGSIYPLLSRLKRQGFVETRLVESAEGPARKYYSLTKAGRAQSVAMAEYFRGLVGGFETLSKTND